MRRSKRIGVVLMMALFMVTLFSVTQVSALKPVRLVKSREGKYTLVEGRIRYWAWVMTYGVDRHIPSLIY